jgi:hypothetical protein
MCTITPWRNIGAASITENGETQSRLTDGTRSWLLAAGVNDFVI